MMSPELLASEQRPRFGSAELSANVLAGSGVQLRRLRVGRVAKRGPALQGFDVFVAQSRGQCVGSTRPVPSAEYPTAAGTCVPRSPAAMMAAQTASSNAPG